ncbi:MAG TPA: 3'-5' exonuclease, partial [Ferruginibacter sp.]|nr:3'-5' exonuclease [Ferruginibacter sp.]
KSLIDKNQGRLINTRPGLSKNLTASNSKINSITIEPELIEYNSMLEEMAAITQKVESLLQQGIAPGKIAIIYKENKYGEELATYFRLKQIPVYSKRNINLLYDPFVNKLVQLLRYLNAEHDTPYGGDEILFEILHYDFYAIPSIEIAKITVEVNSKNYSGEKTSIRSMLADKANAPAKNLFDTGLHPGLKNISGILEQLIADVPNVTLQQLFENIIQNAAVLPYIMQHPQKIALMHLLTAFFDFIKNETARSHDLNLEGFIKIIDLMEQEDVALPMQKTTGNNKAVNLLTAHGSKGLEFEHVFFAGVNASFWEKKKKPAGGYKLPDNLFTNVAANDLEELRRLFYVALTRAETHLYISYAHFNNDGKEMEPSMFLAEIKEAHPQLITKEITLSEEELFAFQELQFLPQAPEIDHAEEDFINTLLEKFVMNVTALNSYLKCPLQFYYQNLIRIPSGKNEATEFGSAVHYALEKLFRKMQDEGKESFPSKKIMLEDFSWYMHKHRENFTKEAFNRRMEYGEEVLGNYYDKYINSWNKVVAVERNIRGVIVNGVPLKGMLDKLEFNGNEINVVDYKTGNIDNALQKLKGPNDKEPNGGDYWRQAVFYKLLIDNYSQKNWKVISSEFDFVEPDKKKAYRKEKIVITPSDTDMVTRQLTDTWKKIQAKEFYTGCGKEDCHWCNFVKDNKLQIALHNLPEEE